MNQVIFVYLIVQLILLLKNIPYFIHQVFLYFFYELVLSCASSTDLQSFVCGSPQNEIAFCSRQSSNIQIMKTPNDSNLSLALRNDNKLLAVGGKDGMYLCGI